MNAMKTKSLILGLVLAGCTLFSGCAAALLGTGAAAGAGAVVFYKGRLHTFENASLDRVWHATQAAAKDLQLEVVTKKKDELAASLRARGASEKRISIGLKRKSDKLTEVDIRVGYFGNKTYSHQILEQIHKDLATKPASTS
jgi:Protein of unknown function (DUF3568)